MDYSQTLLIIIIVVLTSILTILGIQVFFILKDLRRITSKTNNVLDEVKSGTNVAKILGTIFALFAGQKKKNRSESFPKIKKKEGLPEDFLEEGPYLKGRIF